MKLNEYPKVQTVVFTLGGIAVLSGAFAVHGLKSVLSEPMLETWKTAVFYQFVHVFLLLFLTSGVKNKFRTLAIYFAVIGIFVFSGSLYIYCLTQTKIFALFTPIGGIFLVLSWFLAAFNVFYEKRFNRAEK